MRIAAPGQHPVVSLTDHHRKVPIWLQLQGAPDHPAALADAVLVLIDIQEEYCNGALPLDDVVEAARAARDLLALARDNDVPVFHVRHRLPDEAPIFSPRLATFAFLPEVFPLAGEAVFDKSVPNAFSGTDLDAAIRRTGRRELIVAGMQTHLCVSATVRAALDLGYRSAVVAAACASRDLPDGAGGTILAKEVHRTGLGEMADALATVICDTAVWRS